MKMTELWICYGKLPIELMPLAQVKIDLRGRLGSGWTRKRRERERERRPDK